jgi:outer membrane protein OmpA-like peptidoglycan-associated protein
MNKQVIALLSVIVLMPGCGFFKSKKAEKRPVNKKEILTDVDIPVAGDGVKNFFEEDLDELALNDPSFAAPIEEDDNQYAWINRSDKAAQSFKKVYFDFDKYGINSSQKESVDYDISRMKQLLAQEEKTGVRVEFVINGNADHYKGSKTYNYFLSEKRAKTLKDCAVAQGVPADRIKIVGRGTDFPELVNGKPCTGDKDQQAPNRRDEIQVIAVAA